MGKGRPNKPTELKKLEGTYRKDRAPKNEMQPGKLDIVPEAPDYFDDIASSTWHQKATELCNMGILSTIDLDMLAKYCEAISIATNAAIKLKTEPLILKTKNKSGAVYHQKNPLITIWKDAVAEANRIAGQFGFTPSARAKISIPDIKQEDPFEKLLKKA
mgnify:CR=1 FL=1